MNILAIIPARKGSKSILNKNIRKINGKPMMVYSIEHAIKSRYISRTIVSTDSINYSRIAIKYGAEVPFLRPKAISGDSSTDLEVFVHALKWLHENENYHPEICVHLRPTYPLRDYKDIDRMIKILLDNPVADSVRSIVKSPDTPFKMWFMNNLGEIKPVIQTEIREAFNLPRQVLPNTYLQNACIDVLRTKNITVNNSMSGKVIYGYLMDTYYDIDEVNQLKMVRKAMSNKL